MRSNLKASFYWDSPSAKITIPFKNANKANFSLGNLGALGRKVKLHSAKLLAKLRTYVPSWVKNLCWPSLQQQIKI